MERARLVASAVLVMLLAMLYAAGCQQAPAPTPTAAPQPSPTTAPPATATPVPSPTAVPTATAVPKTSTPVASANEPPSAVSPSTGQSFDEMDKLFAETMPTMMAEVLPTMMAVAVPTAMAEVMPTVMAILPTAPPVPKGDVVTLSQSDLGGRWQGWITIEAVTLNGASATEQKSCDDQVKIIKGRQLPTGMDFLPQSATAGTVKVITEQSTQGMSQDESLPYEYRTGVVSITMDGPDGAGSFEGKTIQTPTGYAIAGSWKSEGPMDPSLTGTGGSAVISGNWVVQKPRR